MRVVLSTYCTSTFQRHSTRCLINNLSSYKFSKEIIKWTESWLSNRRQRVLVNGKYSEWLDVTSSVVQGSVLGPLLFGLYINDIDTRLVHSPGFRLFCLGRIGNPLHVTPWDKRAFARLSRRSTMPRLNPMGCLVLTPKIGTLAKSTASSLNGCISAKTQSILKNMIALESSWNHLSDASFLNLVSQANKKL